MTRSRIGIHDSRTIVFMGSGILSAVIGHIGAASPKGEHCGHKGKEQDTFHDGTNDEVKK